MCYDIFSQLLIIMKICIIQSRSVTGDIEANVGNHLRWAERAAEHGAEWLLFPELSLTGYEPTLASELVMQPEDVRLHPLQELASQAQIRIGVGVPTAGTDRPRISLLLLRPDPATQVYSKAFLHPDEEPFFEAAPRSNCLWDDSDIALAICYELSVDEHAATANRHSAQTYLASVAKPAGHIARTHRRLAHLAARFQMSVAMANCVGVNDGWMAGGGSAIWNRRGELVQQLGRDEEGLLLFDEASAIVVED